MDPLLDAEFLYIAEWWGLARSAHHVIGYHSRVKTEWEYFGIVVKQELAVLGRIKGCSEANLKPLPCNRQRKAVAA
jgi:hypothetical protein